MGLMSSAHSFETEENKKADEKNQAQFQILYHPWFVSGTMVDQLPGGLNGVVSRAIHQNNSEALRILNSTDVQSAIVGFDWPISKASLEFQTSGGAQAHIARKMGTVLTVERDDFYYIIGGATACVSADWAL